VLSLGEDFYKIHLKIMIFKTIKDLIEHKSNCTICNSPLHAFLKEKARNKESIPQKRICLINSKFKNQQFEFKLDYCRHNLDIHYQAILNDSNLLILDPPILEENEVEYALSFLTDLFLNIELHCLNKECKHNFYTFTSILKPKYNSDIGVFFLPFFLDWECFNLKHLWIQNDNVSQLTKIYNTNSITTLPITMPLLQISSDNKEKIFNRIKTIVNFR
jgi:hypothetical protein